MDCPWGTQTHAQVVIMIVMIIMIITKITINIHVTIKLRWKIMMLRMTLRGRAGLSS